MSLTPGPIRPDLARAVRAPQRYWQASRSHRYSLLFALPLLVAYEALALVLRTELQGVRSGADVMLKLPFITAAGSNGPLAFLGLVILLGTWLVWRDLRRAGGPLRARVFAGMALESIGLALAFGIVVGTLTARLLAPFTLAIPPIDGMSAPTQFVLSLGAGIYEELLFRVVLVTALVAGARRALRLRPIPAGVVGAVGGALIFSAFHYVGAYGDPLELGSFTFRFIGGLAFSALYLTRGFGITAWTHALYDVFLLLR